jgi:predicted membrane-bound dolichyl-phosphate-mannose-protein mannosyltransferase
MRRLATPTAAPLVALVLVSILSLGARSLLLDEPCQSPCTQAGEHTLIFDEAYYVNAARVIAGIRPPVGSHYADAPLGTDPNAEHPQGAKLIMAAAIELFGDGPFAWRIGSVLMGSIALLGMYALVRSAGGARWPAVGAATLLACDNLLLVHGRIGTLDIYAVAAMIWALALYLWGRPLLSGLVLAVGICFKEVSPYLLIVCVLVELGRLVLARRVDDAPSGWSVRAALVRLVVAGVTAAASFVGLLAIMDAIATPYADSQAKLITGGPFAHIAHILSYGWHLTSPNGPQGIASYPWQWLIDLKPIVYLQVDAPLPGHLAGAIRPVCAFLGMVSPAILIVAIPGVLFAIARTLWPVRSAERPGGHRGWIGAASAADGQFALTGAAWFAGTWVPYALQSLLDQRTSYLYYMVVVTPGLYVAAIAATTIAWRTRRRWVRGVCLAWGLTVVTAAVLMFPFVAIF